MRRSRNIYDGGMMKCIAVTEYNISAPVERDLKFVFLTDLHDYPNKPIFEVLDRLAPDAILIGGDFVSEVKNSNRDRELLKYAVNTAPTFCGLGNHEKRYNRLSGETVEERIDGIGVKVLDDEYISFNGVLIGGLASPPLEAHGVKHTPPPNTQWLSKFAGVDGYKILLSHHPEFYEPYIKPLPINLTLSGHAHGGQWRFFGKGVFAPGQGLLPKYTSGFYDERLIVSRGIGNQTHIPRINNGSEIILLNLKAV